MVMLAWLGKNKNEDCIVKTQFPACCCAVPGSLWQNILLGTLVLVKRLLAELSIVQHPLSFPLPLMYPLG